MSEPIVEQLGRFTPDRGSLDRDGLLFAAGRASARPNRGWIALASTLAVSQLLTLVLLWPGTSPQSVPAIPNTSAPATTPPAGDEPALQSVPSSPVYSGPLELVLQPARQAPLLSRSEMVPDAPPLRAVPISTDIFSN